MKRNKFTRVIAFICLVSHLTAQAGADRVELFFHLAPSSTFAAPEKSNAADGKKMPSRHPSGRRGLAAKLVSLVVSLVPFLPGVMIPGAVVGGAAVLAFPTPARAQDAPSQRVRDLVDQFKLAVRTQNTQQALESLSQIRALEPRKKLAALNNLIEQMNSSDLDYDRQPEILDALLETVFSIIERNRDQMFQLRLMRESSGQERVIYAHPEMVRVEEVAGVLMREMARRMRKVARGEPPAVDHSDDVETRLAGQIFRLYFLAARAGLIPLDPELINELTQIITDMPDRFHRRIVFGFIQGIGEAPANSAMLSRARDWLARLERFCRSQGNWGGANQAYVERLFRTTRESLARRALEGISLPAETSVDRNPSAPPTATPVSSSPISSQPETQSLSRLLIFVLLFVPLVALIFVAVRVIQNVRARRSLAQVQIDPHPDLSLLVSPPQALMIASKITSQTPLFQGFYLIKKLGQGGMGRADLAWDPKVKRYVVIKRMLPDALQDEIFVKRFQREIEVMGKFEPHPNILPIHQCGTDPVLYYVMPFVDGEPLNVVASRKFKQQGTFSLSETIELVIQTAQGVGAAHRKGIIHRDLKLENLFLTRYGKVLVADFGLAHDSADIRNTRLTQSQDIMGTPTYMSPEQINEPKNIDAKTDLYSLGVMLYHLSTGRTPFEEYKKGPYGLIRRKGDARDHDQYPRISQLKPEYPMGFNDIVEKALAFNPSDRYQTAEELISDLEALRQNPTERFIQEAQRVAARKKRKNFWLTMGAIGLAAGSLAAGLVALATGRPPRGRDPAIDPTPAAEAPQAPWLTWAELERTDVERAIARLSEEIRERGGEREAWRSYYYRARLKIQQAQALADLNARRRAYEEALEDLKQAASKMPELRNSPSYYFRCVVIYAGLGDQQRMLECLDQFDQSLQHTQNPDDFRREKEEADEMRARLRALQQTGFLIPELDPRCALPFQLAS